ncbi:hypothetical protein J3R30DRAFT_3491812 [Lentinula aciculospora]|uniref:FHA domain-containing protein n=1 Tax=Lentinula aciculospora TaxID=153920 RepID=A0A9W9A8H2_9AGAR|nr:hypothetical protein J3R30DRAFT_3491812 [Lentinula aciculospora]
MTRIRLKEMEVSKVHASIYWDPIWDGWGVVDMGSKHGTFLRSSNLTHRRLSISKTASVPKRIHHLDHLTFGTTVFIVHIHENQLPCEECSPKLGEEISLFPSGRKSSSKQYPNVGRSSPSYQASDHLVPDSRVALSQLKRELMPKLMHPTGMVSAGQYVDRSARRRAMYPASSYDAPGVSTISQCSLRESLKMSPQQKTEPISEPAAPIPPSSIGHRLLIKQGWLPGAALVAGQLVGPLDLKSNCDRSGLGLRTSKR